MAAVTIRRSQNFVGDRHRALLAREDNPVPVTATAREFACLIFLMVPRGEEHVKRGKKAFEMVRADRKFVNLDRRAERLGYELVRIAVGGEGETPQNRQGESNLLKRSSIIVDRFSNVIGISRTRSRTMDLTLNRKRSDLGAKRQDLASRYIQVPI